MNGGKLRRAIVWLPAVFVCVGAGDWIAVLIWPHGMSFGEPLADRLRIVLQPNANPPEMLALKAAVAASLVLVDVATPRIADGLLLCLAGLLAGGLYYQLFLGGFIDTWFADWPPFMGEIAGLSSLFWPHPVLVAVKLIVSVKGAGDPDWRFE